MSWGPLLVAGAVAAVFFASESVPRRGYIRRLALSMVLGLSTLTALLTLLGYLLPWIPATVLALLLSFVQLKGDGPPPTANEPRVGPATAFLLFIVSTAGWLSAVGGQQLFPDVQYLLWQLPGASPSESAVSVVHGLFGADPLSSSLWAMGLIQVVSLLGLFLFCESGLGTNAVVRNVCFLYLLCSSSRGFLIVTVPDDSLLHLWTVAILLRADQAGTGRFLALPAALATATVSWSLGIGLLLCLVPMRPRMVAVFAVVGAVVSLYAGGPAPGWLVAGLLLVYVTKRAGSFSAETQSMVSRLVLLEFWSLGWGVFAFTGLAYLVSCFLCREWSRAASGFRPRVARGAVLLPIRLVVGIAVFYLALQGVKPGEGFFNDQVLIGSHKERIKLTALFVPRSLQDWLSWRGERFGFGEAERQAVSVLSEAPGRVVYLSGPIPDPFVSALVALASNKPLSGWERTSTGDVSLIPALSAYLQSGQQELLSLVGESVVLLAGAPPVSVAGGAAQVGQVEAHPLTAEFANLPSVLPASSLIPVQVTLQNTTIYLHRNLGLSGAKFEVDYRAGRPLRTMAQPVSAVSIPPLAPGQEVTVTVFLRTAPAPSTFELKLMLLSEDGQSLATETLGDHGFRTWAAAPPSVVPGGALEQP